MTKRGLLSFSQSIPTRKHCEGGRALGMKWNITRQNTVSDVTMYQLLNVTPYAGNPVRGGKRMCIELQALCINPVLSSEDNSSLKHQEHWNSRQLDLQESQ